MTVKPADPLTMEELDSIARALLNAAIKQKNAGYVIIAARQDGSFVTHFNVDKLSLSLLLQGALSELEESLRPPN